MEKMPRLPVIFVLIISTFVGSNPVLQIQVPNQIAPKVAPLPAADVNTKIETTTILANNDSAVVSSSVSPIENKKESLNDTKTAVPPKGTNDTETTIPQHIAKPNEIEKHKKCNSTMESEDMQGCYVPPSHDSGEVTNDNTTQSAAESTTIVNAVTNKTEANKTESQTLKPSPDKTKKEDDKETDNKKKDDKEKVEKKQDDKKKDDKKNEHVTIVPLGSTETTSQVSYATVPTQTSDVKNTNGTGESPKSVTLPATINGTVTSSNSAVHLDKVATVESEGVVAEVKSADRKKSMPSGIIALVTAISFGVAIAMAYIGMIVWRRYVEYRYGHRELLVNELEFDTNDLRHFEL